MIMCSTMAASDQTEAKEAAFLAVKERRVKFQFIVVKKTQRKTAQQINSIMC